MTLHLLNYFPGPTSTLDSGVSCWPREGLGPILEPGLPRTVSAREEPVRQRLGTVEVSRV